MFRLEEVINQIEGVRLIGDGQKQVQEIVSLDGQEIQNTDMFWCSDKNISKLNVDQLGAGIISENVFQQLQERLSSSKGAWLVCENPRRLFMQILTQFVAKKTIWGEVCPSAVIHEDVLMNKMKVSIASNVCIHKGVQIGENVEIGANTVILENTVIEANVKIGCNNTIGGVGFGYEQNESKEFELIPHIGKVYIKSGVEIGNNVCIDRAVIGATIVGENVKIDNLVHIAHGVEIGENSLIIANAMIAGSVKIGSNVWVSPSSSIIQKVVVNDNSLVGMGAVVTKDVEAASVVAGVPAKKIKSK